MQVNIVDKLTGQEVKAVIEQMKDEDFGSIEDYKLNWKDYVKEKEHRSDLIFKLKETNSGVILGMISLIDELRLTHSVEIHKIEVKPENIGRNKRYDNIAGCLIAFACQQSIDKGLGGKVVLISKNKLRWHYHNKYGMTEFMGFLVSNSENSRQLINKYHKAI